VVEEALRKKDRADTCAEHILRYLEEDREEEREVILGAVAQLVRDCLAIERSPSETPKPKKRRPVPKGLRRILGDEIACPHRELSCCAACAALHENLVFIAGHHYWVPDLEARNALVAKLQSGKAAP
jgi:hypothetical protein